MSKFSWTWAVAFACVFWGTAVPTHQHHLSTLIPTLGAYLLASGGGLMVAELFLSRRKR